MPASQCCICIIIATRNVLRLRDLYYGTYTTISVVLVKYTLEPLNNRHIGSRNLVLCWKVVLVSKVD